MSVNQDELLTLIVQDSQQPATTSRADQIKTGIKLFTALPDGASRWLSTIGIIAVNTRPGLWLIGPAAAGSLLAVTNTSVEELANRYPKNKFLQGLKTGTFFADQGIGGLLADFGFAWSMLTTVGIYIGGVAYASNDYAKFIAPALVLLPTVVSTYYNYQSAKGNLTERSIARHAASFLSGAASSSTVFGILMQQGIIAINSAIPTAVMLGVGVLGFLASLVKESYPILSQVLYSLINAACVNFSLAGTMFHVPLDIYAATHDDELSDGFFFGTLGFSSVFLLLLSLQSFFEFQNQLAKIRQGRSHSVIKSAQDLEEGDKFFTLGSDDEEEEEDECQQDDNFEQKSDDENDLESIEDQIQVVVEAQQLSSSSQPIQKIIQQSESVVRNDNSFFGQTSSRALMKKGSSATQTLSPECEEIDADEGPDWRHFSIQ